LFRSVVVKPGEPVEIEPPADLRITNASLGEELGDANGRSLLRLIYSPPTADYDSEDEDEDEDEEKEAEIVETFLCALTPSKVRHMSSICHSCLTHAWNIGRAGDP
jgi:FK506-binding nuclear protein